MSIIEHAQNGRMAPSSISLQVLGPAFYRRAVELRLLNCGGVSLVETPQVLVLLGISWVAQLHTMEVPSAQVVLVVGRDADLVSALRSGVQVFLDEECEDRELLQALHAAAARSGYCSPSLMPALLGELRRGDRVRESRRQTRWDRLSTREQEVARYVGQGWKNERVASKLHVTVATIKFHLSRIYEKLGIECRSQLAASMPRDPREGDSASTIRELDGRSPSRK